MPIDTTAPRFTGDRRIEFGPHHYRDPGPGELLIGIGANAICGTDRHEYQHGSPIVPGHEAAGAVVAAGPGTTTAVGTRGAIYLMDFCGSCRHCRVGATNQCDAKRQDVGQTSDGGYGPYALVHETHFFDIGESLSFASATLLLDVMGTSSHALRRAELVRGDAERIYVCGAGPIGLGLLVMAKLRYGRDFPVLVSDLSPARRDLAEQLGAQVVDAADTAAIGRAAPDLAFDSSGRTAGRRAALDAVTKRGALICVGHGEGLELSVSADLIAPERAVLGSEYFRFDEMADNLSLLQQHEDYLSQVITHRLPVEQLPEAFELFMAGRTGKVVITQDPR